MKRISPALAATAAAVITAPVTAIGATSAGLVDQGVAWLAALVASAIMAALTAAITKVTGAVLDAKARDAINAAMERSARLALAWLLDQAIDTPIGQRLSAGVRRMLPYVVAGAPGSLDRFDLKPKGVISDHLEDMARAELIKQLGAVAPDKLIEALGGAGVTPRRAPVDARPVTTAGGTIR